VVYLSITEQRTLRGQSTSRLPSTTLPTPRGKNFIDPLAIASASLAQKHKIPREHLRAAAPNATRSMIAEASSLHHDYKVALRGLVNGNKNEIVETALEEMAKMAAYLGFQNQKDFRNFLLSFPVLEVQFEIISDQDIKAWSFPNSFRQLRDAVMAIDGSATDRADQAYGDQFLVVKLLPAIKQIDFICDFGS
jgi:hypothetical protein